MPYIHQQESWARSIYPPAPIINGVQLLPLCIGHLVHMQIAGVFERFTKLETIGGAVVDAIAICSQPFEDVVKKVNSGEWVEDVNAVGKVVNKGDVDQAIREFKEYLENSQEQPAYFNKSKSSGVDMGSDWLMMMKMTLQNEMGLDEYELMNRPLTQCIAEHYLIAERNGAIRLMSEHESSLSERAKQDEQMILELAKKARVFNG